MTIKSREVRLVARPSGLPAHSDFKIEELVVPDPGPGQILVRNDWMSVDPAMRGRMRDVPSYVPPFRLDEPMEGGAVGTVVESRADDLAVGDQVLHRLGWRDYAVLDGKHALRVDTRRAPASAYLGVLGMPGLTAYVGLKEIAGVREGDVVFISGAAGAVGLVAARVALHLGAATVIGSAGGPEKAGRLIREFGYDRAIDYKAGPISRSLRGAAPEGIDVYFDNVGGDHLQAALSSLRIGGRVALCGAISQYNEEKPAPGPTNLLQAVRMRLTLRGFIVMDHADLRDEWVDLASGWLEDGSLTSTQTVVEGLAHSVDALLGLLGGANVGKMLVRLNPDAT
ncbi:NADP-dependent oxidoreductase [Acrocarpospora macrocephala]|uniref:NADP-dependent oxidoreductase n=1 Tax=Acrocarpospora macrocephala TaxID=150177 RepID=A0A5M3WIG9_9ACTN|nr:NADP-dependent oxidoreductase [Acrocarpospora macrocephala]GES08945.1 NADP-dependent oxidoreductase [Acrocarpospora macrocephala]